MEWYDKLGERARILGVNLEYTMPNNLVVEMLINRLEYYDLQLRAYKGMVK